MRFMVLMIPSVYRNNKKIDPHFAPPAAAIEKMGKFNTEMQKAGLLMDGLGVHPLTQGARVTFKGGKAQVTDGSLVETRDVFGGYWMLKAKSKEEVIEWMKRCPAEPDDIIEIRQVFEMEDFQSTNRSLS